MNKTTKKTVPLLKPKNLEVQIDEKVFKKIMHWVNKAGNDEVSGLGNVIYDSETKTMRVTEAWLLEQENTGAETELNSESIGKLEYKHIMMQKEGKIEGELNFWWHSHHNMGVFWSGTDYDAITNLGEGGYYLCTVFNNKEEMKTCLYQTDPCAMFVDDIDTSISSEMSLDDIQELLASNGYHVPDAKANALFDLIEPEISEEEIKAWDKEYEDNVTVRTYAFPSYGSYYGFDGLCTPKAWMSSKTSSTRAHNSYPKKEPFPDYDPQKKATDNSQGWQGYTDFIWFDEDLLNEGDWEQFRALTRVESVRDELTDEEIEKYFEDEIGNVSDILEYLDREDLDNLANKC